MSIFEGEDIKLMINGYIINCDLIKTYGITLNINEYLFILFFMGLISRLIANIGLYFILDPKNQKNQHIREPI